MKNHREVAVRKLLRATPDGLTVEMIADKVKTDKTHVGRILKRMPDAYIDRWSPSPAGHRWWRAIWCVVIPPDNCPRPESKK